MHNLRDLLVGGSLFLLGQVLIYIQLNFQFIYPWFKKNPLIISILGIPISYLFVYATRYTVAAFDGAMWPQRFIGFATGMVVYALGTYIYFNQAIDAKTALSLGLALMLILIQIFWK